MEKGVTRETISLIVLVEFPLELVFAVFAGRWASKGHPWDPWLVGYALRLAMAALSTILVAVFPEGATIMSALPFYVAVVAVGIATSFASTLMFVSQGTFFAKISDSSMGGSYLTLLNTIANLGSAWPKFFVFVLIDWLTMQQCAGATAPLPSGVVHCPLKQALEGPLSPCAEAGGTCKKRVDGFYLLSLSMIVVGVVVGHFLRKRLRELGAARADSWRSGG